MKRHAQVVVVDAYNVIHRVAELEHQAGVSLERSRQRLLDLCSLWVSRRRDVSACYVVFDGSSEVVGSHAVSAPGVKAIYTRTGETADSRILAMLERTTRHDRYLVVSDDNEVRRYARIHTMAWISVADFYAALRGPERARPAAGAAAGKAPLPAQTAAQITAELKRYYGLD